FPFLPLELASVHRDDQERLLRRHRRGGCAVYGGDRDSCDGAPFLGAGLSSDAHHGRGRRRGFFLSFFPHHPLLLWRAAPDSSPTPTWLLVGSKLFALGIVQVVLCAVVMLTGIVLQVVKGYFHFELGLYFKQLFVINLIRLCLISVLAMAVHVLVNQKYMGH